MRLPSKQNISRQLITLLVNGIIYTVILISITPFARLSGVIGPFSFSITIQVESNYSSNNFIQLELTSEEAILRSWPIGEEDSSHHIKTSIKHEKAI